MATYIHVIVKAAFKVKTATCHCDLGGRWQYSSACASGDLLCICGMKYKVISTSLFLKVNGTKNRARSAAGHVIHHHVHLESRALPLCYIQ